MNQPKVSCLCVSRGGDDLLQATRDFQAQSWQNKELIVVTSSEVKTLGFVGIDLKFFDPPERSSTGQRRNLAVAAATGEWVCIWDDDDRHHPERIERQMLLGNTRGCTLKQIQIQDARDGSYYESEPRPTGWEGTLLCHRQVLLDHPYADVMRQEDAHIGSLFKKYRMAALASSYLYVYRLHDNNVSGDAHRQHLLRHSKALAPWQVEALKAKWLDTL